MRRVLGLVVVAALLAVVTGAPAQDEELIMRGSRLFVIQGCYGCHTIGKMGTPIGPDLTRVGTRYSESRLARWLQDPDSERPGAHMPLLELAPEQIEALAAFLSELDGS